MRERRSVAPPWVGRVFHWLERRGFDVVAESGDWGFDVTYRRDAVVVNVSYDEGDKVPDLAIARRSETRTDHPPYSARVHLREILERRDPPHVRWNEGHAPFVRGSELLRAYASDLLEGNHLELLDEIIDHRPSRGVPGVDFPVPERWATTQEGSWFTTDSEGPSDMATYLERSRSADPGDRVVAALKIVLASRETADSAELEAGHDRLIDLLRDPDPDVRRAAGSGLGESGDPSPLERISELLDAETGGQSSPFAFALTVLAVDEAPAVKTRMLAALDRFAARGEPAAEQVRRLAWRFEPALVMPEA